jgi:hypothetical protein
MGHILPFHFFPTTALQHPSYPRTTALFSTFHFPNSWLCMASWTGRTPFLPAYQHQRAPLPLAALRTKLLSSIAGFVMPILASHPQHSQSGPLFLCSPRCGFLLLSIRLCALLLVLVARQEPPVALKPWPQ